MAFLLFLSPRLKILQNTSVTAQLESQPQTTPVSQLSYRPSNLPGGKKFAQTFLLLIGAWLACRVSTTQTHVLPFFPSSSPPLFLFKGDLIASFQMLCLTSGNGTIDMANNFLVVSNQYHIIKYSQLRILFIFLPCHLDLI